MKPNTKPCVVIVHPHFTLPGGAGKYAMEVANYWVETHDVIAIGQHVTDYWKQTYPTIQFVSWNGPLTSSVWYWVLWPVWYFKTSHFLSKLRKEREVTLVCSVFPAQWIGLFYKKLHPSLKTVWFCQEPSAFLYYKNWQNAIPSTYKRWAVKLIAPVFKLIDQWLAKSVDTFVVNSYASQKNVEGIYHRKGEVGYGGVTIKPLPVLPIAQRPKQIVTVARLTQFKRIDVLVEAFLNANVSGYTLQIIGDGEAKPKLQQMITAANAQDQIQIRSGLNDQQLAEAYSQSQLFVICSRNEPFGIVAVEAMAYGTPVIADNSGGPAEIVVPHHTGELIQLEVGSLANTLKQLLSQPDTLQRYSDAAKQRAAQEFSWQTTANRLKQYI